VTERKEHNSVDYVRRIRDGRRGTRIPFIGDDGLELIQPSVRQVTGLFPRGKQPGRGAEHQLASSVKFEMKVAANATFLSSGANSPLALYDRM
jgi:hypothetical protein